MKSFFGGLTGRVVVFGDSGYFEARQEFNRAVQQYPVVIDYCRDKLDVANAVAWSKEHRVPLRVRGGGRSFEGYSSGSGTLVIDVSKMDGIGLEEDTGRCMCRAARPTGRCAGMRPPADIRFPAGPVRPSGWPGMFWAADGGPPAGCSALGATALKGLS